MELTLLVGTCDKYSFLWKNFSVLFDRYWDSRIQIEKYFLSETMPVGVEGFQTLTPGAVPYSQCIKYALDNIKTNYVLWMQDDYFLRKKIPKEHFECYLNFIKINKIDRFCFNRYRPHTQFYTLNHLGDNIYRMAQRSNYTISMQASIWDVEFFKSCLPSNGHETPWQFEIFGSHRLNQSRIHKIVYEVTNDYWYQEVMRKGSFTPEYQEILQKERLS